MVKQKKEIQFTAVEAQELEESISRLDGFFKDMTRDIFKLAARSDSDDLANQIVDVSAAIGVCVQFLKVTKRDRTRFLELTGFRI